MAQEGVGPPSTRVAPGDPGGALVLLGRMALIRLLAQRLENRAPAVVEAPVAPGEEAVAVGLAQALRDDDALVAGSSWLPFVLARGGDPLAVIAEWCDDARRRLPGASTAVGGRSHRPTRAGGQAGQVVRGGLPVAVAQSLADRLQGRDRVTACVIDERAAATPAFFDLLRLARRWRLCLLVCLERSAPMPPTPVRPGVIDLLGAAPAAGAGRARALTTDATIDATTETVAPATDLAVEVERAGAAMTVADTADVELIARAAGDAVRTARAGRGPCVLDVRSTPTASPDDPVRRFARRLRDRGAAVEIDTRGIEGAAAQVVEEAMARLEQAVLAERAVREPLERLSRYVLGRRG